MEYVLACSGMGFGALPATPVVFGAVGLLTEGYAGWAKWSPDHLGIQIM